LLAISLSQKLRFQQSIYCRL